MLDMELKWSKCSSNRKNTFEKMKTKYQSLQIIKKQKNIIEKRIRIILDI